MGIRAVVFRPVFDDPSGGENTRKIFFFDAQQGVGFIIFQQDIIAGPVFFNQVVFQKEGIHLGGDNDVFDTLNFFY